MVGMAPSILYVQIRSIYSILKKILKTTSVMIKRWWYFKLRETIDSRIISINEISIRNRISNPTLFFKAVSGVSLFKMSPILYCRFFIISFRFK